MSDLRESPTLTNWKGEPLLEQECYDCGEWTPLGKLVAVKRKVGSLTITVDRRPKSEPDVWACPRTGRTQTSKVKSSRLGMAEPEDVRVPKLVKALVCAGCSIWHARPRPQLFPGLG
jgi:hypothetical protein